MILCPERPTRRFSKTIETIGTLPRTFWERVMFWRPARIGPREYTVSMMLTGTDPEVAIKPDGKGFSLFFKGGEGRVGGITLQSTHPTHHGNEGRQAVVTHNPPDQTEAG